MARSAAGAWMYRHRKVNALQALAVAMSTLVRYVRMAHLSAGAIEKVVRHHRLKTSASLPSAADSYKRVDFAPTRLSSAGRALTRSRHCWKADASLPSVTRMRRSVRSARTEFQSVGGSVQDCPPQEVQFTAISTGFFFNCGLSGNGSLLCWGFSGEPESPVEDEGLTTVSVGFAHGCALREDGTPVCWGKDQSGQSLPEATPPEGEHFTAISAGSFATCALRTDGTPVCWGGSIPSTPQGERFTAISVGSSHTCGLRADGTAVCWSSLDFGQASPPTE